MTDEEIKLKRLSQAIEEDMTENELFEIARERRYRINDLQEENAELKLKNEKLYRTLDHLRKAKNRKQKRIEILQEGDVARFEVWHKRLCELEKENTKLSNSVTELTNTKIELENKVTELEKQIENMKNFYNCSHSSRALCPNEHKCNGCKDWGLAE